MKDGENLGLGLGLGVVLGFVVAQQAWALWQVASKNPARTLARHANQAPKGRRLLARSMIGWRREVWPSGCSG
jgi:hypothetical protein